MHTVLRFYYWSCVVAALCMVYETTNKQDRESFELVEETAGKKFVIGYQLFLVFCPIVNTIFAIADSVIILVNFYNKIRK